EVYGKFKSNGKCVPPNFEAEVQKEQTWLSFVTKKKAADRRPDAAQRAQLKRALRGVHEKELRAERVVIDLDEEPAEVPDMGAWMGEGAITMDEEDGFHDESLALAGLGFGVAMCRELQEAFRSATVEQLRQRRITRE
ncbi:unnamed protein product, partial [Effrenium voratum]